MRALSVRQPWAWAILYAGKDIENRLWQNQHCLGTIAVHASAGLDRLDDLPHGVRRPTSQELDRSAVGVVDVVAVVEHHRSRWFSGPLGWVLSNPRPLPRPIPCKGALGLWESLPKSRAPSRASLPDNETANQALHRTRHTAARPVSLGVRCCARSCDGKRVHWPAFSVSP
jgi:hypothetical protein